MSWEVNRFLTVAVRLSTVARISEPSISLVPEIGKV